MNITLTHKYTWLWKQNGLLDKKDQYGNLQPLQTYISKLSSTAKKLAKSHPIENAYANYFGWQGEVLCEFWLKLFGHRYDLTNVRDTSDEQFTRGFDLTATSIFDPEVKSQIQVKMRGKGDAVFSEGDLFTMLDEADKAEIKPANLVLMVPTCTISKKRDVLSFQNNFRMKGWHRMRIITQEVMIDNIRELPSRFDAGGHEEFLTLFKAAVDAFE